MQRAIADAEHSHLVAPTHALKAPLAADQRSANHRHWSQRNGRTLSASAAALVGLNVLFGPLLRRVLVVNHLLVALLLWVKPKGTFADWGYGAPCNIT